MSKRLEEIEERVNHPNLWPGPWGINEPWKPTNPRFGNQCRIIDENGVWICGIEKNNAEFVANAREDIPYLLSIIRQQGEALAHAKYRDHTHKSWCDGCVLSDKALALTAKKDDMRQGEKK